MFTNFFDKVREKFNSVHYVNLHFLSPILSITSFLIVVVLKDFFLHFMLIVLFSFVIIGQVGWYKHLQKRNLISRNASRTKIFLIAITNFFFACLIGIFPALLHLVFFNILVIESLFFSIGVAYAFGLFLTLCCLVCLFLFSKDSFIKEYDKISIERTLKIKNFVKNFFKRVDVQALSVFVIFSFILSAPYRLL